MSSIVVNALVKQLQAANAAYRVGEPIMSDAEYDAALKRLQKLAPNHSYLHTVEPEPVRNDQGQVQHTHAMLSTDKAYTAEEIDAFLHKVLSLKSELPHLQDGLNKDAVLFRVTPKLDGIAARLYPNQLLATRGDGELGTDISWLLAEGLVCAPDISVPADAQELVTAASLSLATGCLDGELVIPKAYFADNLAANFAYPRNVVAGLAGAKTLTAEHRALFSDAALHFAAYDKLPNFRVSAAMLQENLDYYFTALCENSPYHCDGLIVEVAPEHAQVRNILGSASNFHRYMLAVKRKGDTAQTRVHAVTWQVGRTGALTPVLEIDATPLTGSVIRRVTGHNLDYCRKHHLGPGSTIEIVRAGDVIPKHERTLVPAELTLPTVCPCCQGPVTEEGPALYCRNPECSDQLLHSLSHFFDSIGTCDLFGTKTLAKLIDSGVRSVSSVMRMLAKDFEALGFGVKQSKNLEDQLDRASMTPISDAKWLGAFGLPHLGPGNAKKLLRAFPLETLLAGVTVEQLVAVKGFDTLSARTIVAALQQHAPAILAVLPDFSLQRTLVVAADASAPTVCFTGSFAGHTRTSITEWAEHAGAVVHGSVSSKTQYLVCDGKLGDSKRKAAEKHGTKVIDLAAFTCILEGGTA